MFQAQLIKQIVFIIALAVWGIALSTSPSFARESASTPSKNVPCVIPQVVQGQVEALDPTRTTIIPVIVSEGIVCGAWFSVKEGILVLKHRQGFEIRVASGSFFQIFDNEADRQQTGPEHLILYRGKMYISVANGPDTLRVITPNARARIHDNTVILIYNQDREQTQLVSLGAESILENRFESDTQISVHSGEATQLSLSEERVVPSTPEAVLFSSLNELLNGFTLTPNEQTFAAVAVKNRNDRAVATELPVNRSVASNKNSRYNYTRHGQTGGDPIGEKAWSNRLVGGAEGAQRLLFPNRKPSSLKASQGQVIIQNQGPDPAAEFDAREQKQINQERDRLIKQLKNLRQD